VVPVEGISFDSAEPLTITEEEPGDFVSLAGSDCRFGFFAGVLFSALKYARPDGDTEVSEFGVVV
jgi:hypothetical protein